MQTLNGRELWRLEKRERGGESEKVEREIERKIDRN